tara:strand:- start:300 stop:437 length:138 start_codon:yes stop_codon:yes gene_type:complete
MHIDREYLNLEIDQYELVYLKDLFFGLALWETVLGFTKWHNFGVN